MSVNACPEPVLIGIDSHGKEIWSSIVKKPVAGVAQIGPMGLIDDSQADQKVHGGPDKAVYLYSATHWRTWQAWLDDLNSQRPDRLDLTFGPGTLGENFSLEVLPDDVCEGDRFDVFSAEGERRGFVLMATVPREPCHKLNTIIPGASAEMVRNGRNGFYCRVQLDPHLKKANKPAWVQSGDILVPTERRTMDEILRQKGRVVHGM